jgi:hypothetical protein
MVRFYLNYTIESSSMLMSGLSFLTIRKQVS